MDDKTDRAARQKLADDLAARILDPIAAGNRAALHAWEYEMCRHNRSLALKIMMRAGLVVKTDQADGSAILDYVKPDHPAVVVFLRTSGDGCALCIETKVPHAPAHRLN